MPDVFADITAAPSEALETIANVPELRASIPQQQEMLRASRETCRSPGEASSHRRIRMVILHTLLTHVPGPEAVLAEAHRVLRPGGWRGVCDGDFSTATVAVQDLDPLEVCVHAFVEGFVNDRWMVRRMSRLAENAGFHVSPLRSYGLVEDLFRLHGLRQHGGAQSRIVQPALRDAVRPS